MYVAYAIFIAMVGNFPAVHTSCEFPDDFMFGVSTAAYQIEGAWNSSNKGESIWDRFCHCNPSRIVDESNGDIACDSYHQVREDLSDLRKLGVHFYRFSISWPRILPSGFVNKPNQDGITYYAELIDQLLAGNIEPMITLYHWDLPQRLQDLGGWANPNVIGYFVDYAHLIFKLFASRVKYWITFNEPGEICETGYGLGINAPGINMSGIADYLCGRNLLLAHARVYHMFNTEFKRRDDKLGITISTPWYEPKTRAPPDVQAAERAMQMEFGWWASPIFSRRGDYPQIMKDRISNISHCDNFAHSRLPSFTRSEIRYIRGSADFLGLNHYTTYLVSNSEFPGNKTSHARDVSVRKEVDEKWPSSKAKWLKVVPWGFGKVLNWIKNEYNNPLIYITENGYADDGNILDLDRVKYHASYLKVLQKSMKEGSNVKGYAIWSLMDNWEWVDGFTLKFGLFHVDFNDCSRPRTPKSSFNFYRDLINLREIPAICFEGAPIVPKVEQI